MSYKHYCVIDAENHYKHLVLVVDGEVQYYTLKDGETLADTNPPRMRNHEGENGFISPAWNGDAWQETATAEEIAVWEAEHPAPEVVEVVSQLDMIEAQVTYTAMMTDTLLEV